MAHGDYHCCAICDCKMGYSSDAETKESLCAGCAVAFFEATGRKVFTAEQLIDWMRAAGPMSVGFLRALGYSKCFYWNPVDDAVQAFTPSEEGEATERCPAHLLPEPCPTCAAYIAGGL